MRKIWVFVFMVTAILLVGMSTAHMEGCGNHIPNENGWTRILDPTCMTEGIDEARCATCGYHYTKPVAKTGYHDYNNATCTAPQICKFGCGTTLGEPLGHQYSNATCQSYATCIRCDDTTGELGAHNYSPWSCTGPVSCTVCGTTIQNPGGHQYSPATCGSPATCTVCGTPSGSALGHDFEPATCQHPSTCSRCNATTGAALDHLFVNGRCVMCGRQEAVINGVEIPEPEIE